MRLLSRMQRDLALLTNNNERPATYPEVNEYLGHALIAEGIAPRGYTADEAAKWWRMGGSAVLDASMSRQGGSDSVASVEAGAHDKDEAAPGMSTRAAIVDDGLSNWRSDSNAGRPNAVDSAIHSGQDDAATNSDVAETPTRQDSGSTTENASEEIAGFTAPPLSTAGSKLKQPVVSKAATDDSVKRAKQAIAAATIAAKTEAPAPLGTDLSTYYDGFGDSAHAFHGDYRTTPQMRAWIPGIEPLAGKAIPYPDGLPGDRKYSSAERGRIRDYVAYLYTLPEVKAFLDLIAHNEGTDEKGYSTTFFGHKPDTLPDLNTFHGGVHASGRYQIEAGPWKDVGGALWSRTDFSPITQDLIAITQLYQTHAIDALMKGDLSTALTIAAGTFASIHVSLQEDHSRYTKSYNVGGSKAKVDRLQGLGTSQPFSELPAEFAKHLEYRRAEFRQAEQEWKSGKILPWAFIPPTRWQSFGLHGFDPKP